MQAFISCCETAFTAAHVLPQVAHQVVERSLSETSDIASDNDENTNTNTMETSLLEEFPHLKKTRRRKDGSRSKRESQKLKTELLKTELSGTSRLRDSEIVVMAHKAETMAAVDFRHAEERRWKDLVSDLKVGSSDMWAKREEVSARKRVERMRTRTMELAAESG
eukprot:CAMPEP_0194524620 /NCGR_PEP_ID=MMETSP0253-20130528/59841_1 /TAXON_ID=2966 /ORGANISM="Noctiluca scintillans" /LENGTH=164 /DNA_ID=CAMNT_0039369265 /DNA_START=87 /DNA_END=581 /DNA_ORIENTATION=+